MKLIIMRHGEAGSHKADRLRSLTARGESDSQQVAAALAASTWRPAAIWCSPLVRAQQTAAIVGGALDLEVIEQSWLKPEDSIDDLMAELQGYQGLEPLLIVSHMPLVGALAGRLTDGPGANLTLATSQAVCLDMAVAAAGCAELCQQYCAEPCG